MNEYGETEFAVTDGERDVLFEVLSSEYQKAHAEYRIAIQEWSEHPNDGADAKCCEWSERLTDIESLLIKLGFEIDVQYTTVRYRAMADG